MLDEVRVYARLESPMFGALAHVIATTATQVRADVSAIRVFDSVAHPTGTYVEARRLRLPEEHEAALQAWPEAPDSIFEFARERSMFDTTFRPRQAVDEATYSQAGFFRGLLPHVTVTDAYCITFPLVGPAWCMVAYLRSEPRGAFDESEFAALHRFKPAMLRVVKSGYHRHVQTQVQGSIKPGLSAEQARMSPADVIAKLSRTERQILQYLYTTATERQIAQSIHRSPHTVHVHVKNIYRKLGVNSRRQLQALAAG
jgi:DNA-binding CsgD family transcriptional regulator